MYDLAQYVRAVPDFPTPGVTFRDITPLLENGPAFARVVDAFAERYVQHGLTKICGIESRGFIFASALAYRLGCGVVLVRKPGKLPRATRAMSYALEYGTGTLHIHEDAVGPDDKVVLCDDVIATGGTADAAARLLQQGGARVEEVAVLIELVTLGGRNAIGGLPLFSLLAY